jgi:hypothetical protein
MDWTRAGLIILTFMAVGPLCGLVAALAAMDALLLWQAGSLKAKQSTLFGLSDATLGPIMVSLAYIAGAAPTFLTGTYVAWRSRGGQQISLAEGTLASLGFGAVIGGLTVGVMLWGARPSIRILDAFVLAVPASLAAGFICTWLTRRWQRASN